MNGRHYGLILTCNNQYSFHRNGNREKNICLCCCKTKMINVKKECAVVPILAELEYESS